MRITTLIMLLVGLALVAGPAGAQDGAKAVTVTGEGAGADAAAAKEMATEDALRKAVEKAMGVFLSSQTETEDFVTVRDKIFAEARGLVKSYKVTGVVREGEITKVTIRAIVIPSVVTAKWDAIRHLIHRKNRPNMMFLIYEMGLAQRPAATGVGAFRTMAARTLTNAMEEHFSGNRYRMIDHEQYLAKKGAEIDASKLEQNLQRIASEIRKDGAQVLVYGYVRAVHGGTVAIPDTNLVLKKVSVTISAKAIRADTALILASMAREYTGTGMSYAQAVTKALQKAGKSYAKSIERKILEAWMTQVQAANNIRLVVENIKFMQVVKLQRALKSQRWIGQMSKRSYSNQIQEWDIETRLNAEQLAEKLSEMGGPVAIEVTGLTQNTVKAKIVPRNE